MSCYLSKTEISSFKGDVISLTLHSDEDIEKAPIVWSTDSGAVRIREFTGDFSLNDSVVLSLKEVGRATVTATLYGKEYSCKVNVREREVAKEGDRLNHYIGDVHVHSTMDHRNLTFFYRNSEFPADGIKMTQDEGKLDFTVVTDHGSLLFHKNFVRGFTDAEELDNGELIVFPGSESEISYVTKNKYGLFEVPCGEFVLLNSATYCFVDTFEKVEEALADDVLPIVSIAHPQEFSSMKGYCLSGIDFTEKRSDKWKSLVKTIELGNGSDRGTTMLLEYSYSLALDNGYKVSPVSASDTHGPVWGYAAMPGTTVVLAPKKSKDMIIDAIYNRRTYATENGATKLLYTVNGKVMGSDIPLTSKYDFHVEIGSLFEDTEIKTAKCEVISDYGKKIKIIEGVDFSCFDFTVESDSARYFYLRIIHEDGSKTFSPPVFLGRKYDELTGEDGLTEIDKSTVKVVSASSEGAEKLLNGNPRDPWSTGLKQAEVVFDMGAPTDISALRIWDRYLDLREIRREKLNISDLVSEFLAGYRISLSNDGESFTPVAEGYVQKTFNGYFARFEKQSARYVKLELLESIGAAYGRYHYPEAKIQLGEVDFYE